MSREFPDLINPWKAADGRRLFQGTIPLKRMTRLVPLLASDEGTAAFSAKFAYDEQKDIIIDLSVSAELSLVCQRSLEPYIEPVRRSSRLVVIEDPAQQELIPESYDPVLLEHRRLVFQQVVEDELLLGIPQVPRNPDVKEIVMATDGVVEPASAENKEPLQRPFAGLAEMLKDKAQE